MDWAFDAFSWLAPDLVSEILVMPGAAGLALFLKKNATALSGRNTPWSLLYEMDGAEVIAC
jgi:hypothetical protein